MFSLLISAFIVLCSSFQTPVALRLEILALISAFIVLCSSFQTPVALRLEILALIP
jgi:hypothetical protein